MESGEDTKTASKAQAKPQDVTKEVKVLRRVLEIRPSNTDFSPGSTSQSITSHNLEIKKLLTKIDEHSKENHSGTDVGVDFPYTYANGFVTFGRPECRACDYKFDTKLVMIENVQKLTKDLEEAKFKEKVAKSRTPNLEDDQDTSEKLIQFHFEEKHPGITPVGHCKHLCDWYEEGAKFKVECTICNETIYSFGVPTELFENIRGPAPTSKDHTNIKRYVG